MGFTVDSPLTNNDVTPSDKSVLQTCANLFGQDGDGGNEVGHELEQKR